MWCSHRWQKNVTQKSESRWTWEYPRRLHSPYLWGKENPMNFNILHYSSWTFQGGAEMETKFLIKTGHSRLYIYICSQKTMHPEVSNLCDSKCWIISSLKRRLDLIDIWFQWRMGKIRYNEIFFLLEIVTIRKLYFLSHWRK